jgi:hypothetical protein
MSKRFKLIIGALVVILIIGSVAFASSQGSELEGKFHFNVEKYDFNIHELETVLNCDPRYASIAVSDVTSEVPSDVTSEVISEVPSEVTSDGGTSIVISEVPSDVTSEVTSGVTSLVPTCVPNKKGKGKLDFLKFWRK